MANTTNNSSSNQSGKKSFISDTLKEQTGQTEETKLVTVIDFLRSIDNTTKEILKSSGSFSQSAARDNDNERRSVFRSQYEDSVNNATGGKKKKSYGSFADELEGAFWDEILGKDFKDQMGKIVEGFANDLGVSVKDIPGKLGRTLGEVGLEAFKNTSIGQKASSAVSNLKAKGAQWVQDNFNAGEAKYGRSDLGDTLNKFTNSWGAKPDEDRSARWGQSQTQSQSQARNDQDIDESSAASRTAEAANQKAKEQATDYARDKAQEAIRNNMAEQARTSAASSSATSSAAVGAAETAGAQGAAATGTELLTTSATSEAAGMAATSEAAGSAAGALGGLGSIAQAIGSAAMAAAPYILAAVAALAVLKLGSLALKKELEDLKEAANNLKESLSNTLNRDRETSKKATEEAQKRLEADVKTLVEKPFEILEESAEEVRSAWKEAIRTINQTQGYDKADLQDLMASYADRLRQEGLTDAINASNLTTNLQKVLESGLSGEAAEEFAYVATKLSAAIPTEDFFSYSSSYASLIASNTAAGMSQADAITYATQQLEQFASNLLYSQRQIANGLSTGLKDASSLFEESVKIVQTAKSGDVGQLSSVLTAVSAVTGSVAPDLANSITEIITKAATGGNSSEIVALRSLAGGNASNTEFLQRLVENPEEVFYSLFSNLASYQKMSDSNFMEVAEGLADVFGVSMDAFARIDFDYLAKAIKSSNKSDQALNENLELLASGESTTNAEILKNRQINQYIVDEGLSMIIDNDAAMAIQKHMWDEQIALQLQEATYGVEITGAMKELWTSLKNTVSKILNFLNPIGWLIKSVNNVVSSVQESNALEADIKQVLVAGRVGTSVDFNALTSLTTRGKIQNTTDSLVELLGGISTYDIVSTKRNAVNTATDLLLGSWYQQIGAATKIGSSIQGAVSSKIADIWYSTGISSKSGVSSNYSWGSISKSQASFLQSTADSVKTLSESLSETTESTSTTNKLLQSNFERMLDSMSSAVDEGKSYESWKATAKSFGISDFESALDTLGYAATDLENHFTDLQSQKGQKEQETIYEEEAGIRKAQLHFYPLGEIFFDDTRTWYDEAREFFDVTSLGSDNHFSVVQSIQRAGNELLLKILNKNTEFKKAFDDYFVNHLSYDSEYDATDVRRIQNDESKENSDAIYALAEALTASDLKDPTMQTNALLGQILLVVQSIMQQNNTTGKLSLIDSLQAMATGQYQVYNL